MAASLAPWLYPGEHIVWSESPARLACAWEHVWPLLLEYAGAGLALGAMCLFAGLDIIKFSTLWIAFLFLMSACWMHLAWQDARGVAYAVSNKRIFALFGLEPGGEPGTIVWLDSRGLDTIEVFCLNASATGCVFFSKMSMILLLLKPERAFRFESFDREIHRMSWFGRLRRRVRDYGCQGFLGIRDVMGAAKAIAAIEVTPEPPPSPWPGGKLPI